MKQIFDRAPPCGVTRGAVAPVHGPRARIGARSDRSGARLSCAAPRLGAAVVLGLAVALTACDRAEPPPEGPPPVKPVKTVVTSSTGRGGLRTFPGRVDASQTVELSFSVSGKLQELPVKEGQTVQAGDVVAQLDPTDFETAVADRQAQFDRAQADFSRAEELIKRDFISRSDYDRLEAQLRSTAANLKRANTDLGYTTLAAPFKGRVAQRYVDNFTEVQAKEPVMAIQDVETLEVKISLPENLVRSARRSQNDGEKPPVVARFEGIPGQAYPLTFKEISTRADPDTQTFEVTLTLKDPEGIQLLPGMTASVDVDMTNSLGGSECSSCCRSARWSGDGREEPNRLGGRRGRPCRSRRGRCPSVG